MYSSALELQLVIVQNVKPDRRNAHRGVSKYLVLVGIQRKGMRECG